MRGWWKCKGGGQNMIHLYAEESPYCLDPSALGACADGGVTGGGEGLNIAKERATTGYH